MRVANRARRMSAYMAVALLPGGFIVLPLVIWWRRRQRAAKRVRSNLRDVTKPVALV
jgi:hypothetical protein